jgi:signal transduction histidine kinase
MGASEGRKRIQVDDGERQRMLELKQNIDEDIKKLVLNYRRMEDLNRELKLKARSADLDLEQARSQLYSAHWDLKECQRREAGLLNLLLAGLKNPLNLIEQHIQRLFSENGARREKSMELLRDEVHRLRQIVEGLSVAGAVQIGKARLKREKVDLKKLVCRVLEEHQGAACGLHVGLSEDIDGRLPVALGNRKQLKLALNHLVDNAITHSPTGGTVTVQANGRHPKDRVSLNIIDQRQDVLTKEALTALWGRAPAKNVPDFEVQGFDLELVAARYIVGTLDGQIAVKSRPGKETVFTLTLPAESYAERRP